jgi:hypothetical protein
MFHPFVKKHFKKELKLPGSRPDTGTAAQDDVRDTSEFGRWRKKSNISPSCDTSAGQQDRPTEDQPIWLVM